jgi:DNA-binding CsgD family transcriptional regulator
MDQINAAGGELLSRTFQNIPSGPRQCFPGLSKSFRDVPGDSHIGDGSEFERPKPTRRAQKRDDGQAMLSARHLAAARWLARGMRTQEVAEALGTTRQTINAWRRRAGFAAELSRLHALLAAAPASPLRAAPVQRLPPPAQRPAAPVHRPAAPAQRPAGRRRRVDDDDDDEEINATMNRILSMPVKGERDL